MHPCQECREQGYRRLELLRCRPGSIRFSSLLASHDCRATRRVRLITLVRVPRLPTGQARWCRAAKPRSSSPVWVTRSRIILRKTMPVTISDEVLAAARISEPELKRELALTLFQQDRLTLAQASHFAEMSQLAFQALLAERQIPIHYGVEEFHEDLRALRRTEGH